MHACCVMARSLPQIVEHVMYAVCPKWVIHRADGTVGRSFGHRSTSSPRRPVELPSVEVRVASSRWSSQSGGSRVHELGLDELSPKLRGNYLLVAVDVAVDLLGAPHADRNA